MACILAIDTSIGVCSVAVRRHGKPTIYLENRESSMQSARLMPLVEEALKRAKIRYEDLTLVATTVGPGSFTGIRIGLASARAIAFAAKLPCLGFTTLEVMAHANAEEHTLSIINAGKGEVFFQYFGAEKTEPAIGALEEILKRYPNASIASSLPLPEAFPLSHITHPRADALVELAALYPERAREPSPFYIRPPDAKPQATMKI